MSDELVGVSKAAALHGIAINGAFSPADRLRAAVQALDIYEQEYDTLVAERDRLRAERDEARGYVDTAVGASVRAAAERDALAASLDWVRRDTCTMCEQGICSVHQPAAGVIAAAQERLRAGCPAWGPGSGYVHVSEIEMAALTDERDRLQRDRDNLTIMFNDEVRWRSAANNRAGVLRVRLMRAERVVEALAASLDWVRTDACATCAQGICSAHQPAAGVIAAIKGPDDDG